MVHIRRPPRSKKKFYIELVQSAKLDIPPKFTSAVIDIILKKRIDERLSTGNVSPSELNTFEKEISSSLLQEKKSWNVILRSYATRIFALISSILGLIHMSFEIAKYIRKLRGIATKKPRGDDKNGKNGGGNSGNNPSKLTRELSSRVDIIREMAEHGGTISFPGSRNPSAYPSVQGPPVQQQRYTDRTLEETVKRLINEAARRNYETPQRPVPQGSSPSTRLPNIPGQIPRPLE